MVIGSDISSTNLVYVCEVETQVVNVPGVELEHTECLLFMVYQRVALTLKDLSSFGK